MKKGLKIFILFTVNLVAAALLVHSITTYAPSAGVTQFEQVLSLYLSIALNLGMILFVIFRTQSVAILFRGLMIFPASLLLILGLLISQHSILESVLTYFKM